MKITYDPRNGNEDAKKKANEHCDVCPICGETRSFGVSDECKFYGILHTGYRSDIKGFFRTRTIYADIYVCHTCGARYESDEYEVQ